MATTQADQGSGKPESGQWMPAVKMGLAFIAVLVAILFLRPIVIILVNPFSGILLSWTTNNGDTYPLLSAVSDLSLGIILLLMAVIPDLIRDSPGLSSIRRWPMLDGRNKDLFIVGLVLGVIVFTAATIVITAIHLNQIPYPLLLSFMPEELAVTLIMLIPVLAISAGKVALVQGFFQRMLSEKNGMIASVFLAAFIFMILGLFPEHISQLLSLPGWQTVIIFFLTGAVVAYLFQLTKSLYMPIGFLFAYNIMYYFLSAIALEAWPSRFFPVTWAGALPIPFLDDFPIVSGMYVDVSDGIKILFLSVTLAMIWYFRNRTREDLHRLMDRVKNAYKKFLSNLAKD